MAVYVDSAFTPYKSQRMRGRTYLMSHMMADTMEELHEMAERIGVRRVHFQGDHYDICKSKRQAAIDAGAQVVTSRELVMLRQRAR